MVAQQEAAPQQRYELVSTLGKGGMAEVFLGWMNSVGGLRRKVAIKRILPDLVQKQSQLFEQMFVDEARLAFQLEHDNIVRVYDVGQSSNTFFIVMEYVEGMDLKRIYSEMVKRKRFLDLGTCLYLGAQVAAGLAYAHSFSDDEGNLLGLVHNDISPPNILIGRHGEVKIADFGLSDARGHSVETPEGMVKGKFAYISPESTRDPSQVSYRSDIFSVGVVLWEMVANQRLFQKDSDLETFQAVRNVVIPDIRRFRPDVPQPLIEVLHRALAGNPAERYGSAEELFHDLTALSVELRLPLNRFGLQALVNELAGKKQAFAGTQVSEQEANAILNEVESMLPPGVAAHLKTFVTGMSVAADVEESAFVQEDWAADVFEDLGFDEHEEGAFENDHEAAPKQPTPAKPAAATKAPTPAKPAPTVAPAPAKPKAAPPPTETSPTQHSPSPSRITNDSVMVAMQAEMASQKVTYIIWGTIGGLVLGSALGFAIGTLI